MLKQIEITTDSKLSNLVFVSFFGLANGTTLQKTNNVQYLAQNYLKIKYVDIGYYTDNTSWVQKAYYDNTGFLPNANTRYDLLRPYTKIDLTQHECQQYPNDFSLFIDSQKVNIFPNLSDPGTNIMKLPEHLEINALTDSQLTSTIDMTASITLLKEYETPNFATPIVIITMLIEKLGNKKNNAIQF